MNGKAVNIGLHIIVWLFFLTLPIFIFPNIPKLFTYNVCHFINYLIISALLVLLFYFNYHFAVPYYYFKQKYFSFVGIHIAFLIGVFITFIILNQFIIGPCVNPVIERSFRNLIRVVLPRHLFVFFVSLFMGVNKKLQSIDAQKTKTELQLLRAQVNPHFLFNVLNTIYGQAITKSANTADSIAKLSDLMRYSLKEANVPTISLAKEIAYIESYIALQKLRLTDKTTVDFQIHEDVNTWQIPPMLFIPFIENAFKFGVSNEVETTVKIVLKVTDQEIVLWVDNTKLTNRAFIGESNQIGIKNVKSRLDLIYGSRYTLDIKDTETHYSVQLKIFS